MTPEEINAFVRAHGCFCGGAGHYIDFNCGESFEVHCPHCDGSGRKRCECGAPALRCKRPSSVARQTS